LSIIVTTIISRFTTDDPILLGLIFIYSFSFIFSAFNIIDYYFQSQVLSKYPAMVTIAVGIISAILKVIAMTFGLGIIWLTAIYILESILTALGLIFFFIFKGHSIKEWIFDKKTALIILKDSWPLMISMVAWSIYMKIDQVMIKNMIGNEQNGIYAVAAKLAEFWYFIPGMICTSILPAIINAKKTSKELYEKRLSKLYLLMFCLSLFVALFISFFAYYIIYIIFGNQYLEAVTTLRIYVWAGIAVSLGTALSYYLIIENMTKITAIATVIGAVVNVILNFILIPRYGINGAAIASVVSYMIVTLSMLSFLKQKIINLIK
ncbi:MAG: flippase, partial [Candidatus Falkowbacteria bacterium]|nr:flippase [Candidatus Falkowbacteria bacterium]